MLIIWLDGTDVLFNLLSIGTYGFDVGQEITKLRITLHDPLSIPNNYLDGSNLSKLSSRNEECAVCRSVLDHEWLALGEQPIRDKDRATS